MPCRFEIGAEWFLQNDARPASFASLVQSGFLQILHDRFELIRRSREVEKAIAARPALLVEPVEALREFLVTGFVAKLALMIEERLGKAVPDFVAHRLPGKFAGRFLHFLAKFLIALRTAGETHHRHRRGEFAVRGDIVKRGNEFAVCQVAGRAKNHHRARLRHRFGREPFAQWIGLLLFGHGL